MENKVYASGGKKDMIMDKNMITEPAAPNFLAWAKELIYCHFHLIFDIRCFHPLIIFVRF
ncbi:MAG TPA: hypothetical protein VIO58_04445 [Candidatus Methanoperedens sp.]